MLLCREIVVLVKLLKYEAITAYFVLGVNSSWSKQVVSLPRLLALS